MSKYVIIHGQFHEVSDDELMHWKYVKRHRVNGKWQYTYPSDNVPNKSSSTPKVSKEYQAEVAYNSQKNVYPSKDSSTNTSKKTTTYTNVNKPKINNPNSGKAKAGKDAVSNNLKWVEQKEWVDSLAADRKSRGAEYPNNYEKYREYQKNPNKSLIDKIKDKLGVDERDIYYEAAQNKRRTEENAKASQKEAERELDSYKRLDELGIFDGEYALDRESHWDSYQRANNVATMDKAYAEAYGKAYIELREEFLKTPLGKIYNAEEKVDKAISDARESTEKWVNDQIDNLEDWFDSIKKSRKRKKT